MAACFGIPCQAVINLLHVIAITETGGDTGYFGKSCVATCFGIPCQAVINLTHVIAIVPTDNKMVKARCKVEFFRIKPCYYRDRG